MSQTTPTRLSADCPLCPAADKHKFCSFHHLEAMDYYFGSKWREMGKQSPVPERPFSPSENRVSPSASLKPLNAESKESTVGEITSVFDSLVSISRTISKSITGDSKQD